jgi:hypothetical protein
VAAFQEELMADQQQEISQPENQQDSENQPEQESQQDSQPEQDQPKQSKQSRKDRIAELEDKIARIEAAQSIANLNVVDAEVVTDLLLKGYTVAQLQKSKPYLFRGSQAPAIKQPQKIVTPAVPPKTEQKEKSVSFVDLLANRFKSQFFKED